MKCVLLKAGSGLYKTATDLDAEELSKYGAMLSVEVRSARQRSVKHHRLFYGGLLRLAFDYWQPEGGLVSPAERHAVDSFCDYLGQFTGDPEAIRLAGERFFADLSKKRSDKIDVPNKSIEAFLDWVKVEAGHFDYVQTPTGLKKVPKSISFASMSQDDFNEFYKKAFNVVWSFILSRTFHSEQDAHNAINNLMEFGQ